MHKLPVAGGFVGILFAVGSAMIFILGFPALWYFVAFSAGLGAITALIIKTLHQRNSDRNKPLSILAVPAKPVKSFPARAKNNGHLLRSKLHPLTA